MVSEKRLRVTVVCSPAAREVQEVSLELTVPCSVLQALQQSGLLAKFPEIDHQQIVVGVWGRKAPLDQLLRHQDRVEVYRPLRVDPKVARRERFASQGSRGAGLFVKKRAGAKAGY
jgi:putative ubiquitin-RnfH superfamily antitoxin RatB of RatAB toxin-antitoxin module